MYNYRQREKEETKGNGKGKTKEGKQQRKKRREPDQQSRSDMTFSAHAAAPRGPVQPGLICWTHVSSRCQRTDGPSTLE